MKVQLRSFVFGQRSTVVLTCPVSLLRTLQHASASDLYPTSVRIHHRPQDTSQCAQVLVQAHSNK
eukprot:6490977-Amphidinium_carterae.1